MLVVSKWFLYFIIYSFMGWITEVIYCIFTEKKLVNRGFLIGPICPIYGYGVILILLLIDGNKSDILAIFLKSILICSLLEYFTSFFMEKLFKARWWDYSDRKYNINGRVCLETMIPFGILGSLVVLVLHPSIEKLISCFGNNFIIVLAIIIFVIYLIDNFISFNVMSKIKNEIKHYSKDSTEVIRSKITEWLKNNTFLFKRIIKAFPGVSIINKMKDKVLK